MWTEYYRRNIESICFRTILRVAQHTIFSFHELRTTWKSAAALGKLEWPGPRYVSFVARQSRKSFQKRSIVEHPHPLECYKGSYGRAIFDTMGLAASTPT